MKKIIIGKCMQLIKNNNPGYDSTKLDEIKYGLSSIYLLISKAIIIFTIAFLLGIMEEMLILLLLYNVIRMPSFGLHATKSWICLLSSTTIFIGVPYLCSIIDMSTLVKCIVGVICILLIYKNAPADTLKKPIINIRRREVYKFISVAVAITYVFASILIDSSLISNTLLFALIIQNIMISPTVYRIFKLPYDNYKNYKI